MEVHETVIVGGGIAGLACARRLCDAGAGFTLVTEDVGGRIRRSRDGALNLGAYYVMADYRHVAPWVERGRELRMLGSRVHLGERSYTPRGWRTLPLLPQSLRFRRLLREFRDHYEAFKKACENTSQARALRSDPFLWDLYRRSAMDFVREHRLERFVEAFLAPGLRGSTFLPVRQLSGFVFLQFSLPLIVPVYEFSFRKEAMVAGFERSIRMGSVTRIAREAGRHRVELAGGEGLTARHVVVATPIGVSRRLLDLGPVKRPVHAHMFQIEGDLRPGFGREAIHLFGQEDRMLAIARQEDGSVLLCSLDEKPELERFFEHCRVVEHHEWSPAFHLEGDTLLECEQGENLYLIGDCNVCGLEDSFITGLYAANRILGAWGPVESAGTEDHKEAVRAFIEKRSSDLEER